MPAQAEALAGPAQLEAAGRGRADWQPESAAAAALSARLDLELQEQSAVYARWRRKGGIGAPEVCVVAPGAISEELRARRLAEGVAPQQLKVSRVLRDPAHAALLRLRPHPLPRP